MIHALVYPKGVGRISPPTWSFDRFLFFARPMVVLCFIGLGLIWVGWGYGAWHAFHARHWLPADCRILESRVEPPARNRVTHRARVRYAYQVAGRSHEGTDHSFLRRGYDDEAIARRVVALYPAGSVSRCWYDPASPHVSVLDRSVPPLEDLRGVLLAMGLTVLALGLLPFSGRFRRWVDGTWGVPGTR